MPGIFLSPESLSSVLKEAFFASLLVTLGKQLIHSVLIKSTLELVFLAFSIRLLNTKHLCYVPSDIFFFCLLLAKQKKTRIMHQHEASGLSEHSVIVFLQPTSSLGDSF